MKNKIIIFEGLDRCGKNTQIKLLLPILSNLPTQVLHYCGFKGLSKEENIKYNQSLYNDLFLLIKQSKNRNLIFNRSHIGEYVYSPLYRNYSGDYIYNIEKKYIDEKFWQNIYLITFVDKTENLINREDGKSFSIDKKQKLKKIKLFKEATNKSFIKNKIIININNKSIETVHKNIKKFLYL